MSTPKPSGSSSGSAPSDTGPVAGDDRPLNDNEFQLVQRLLSDPFSFPLSFKSWIVSYLEASDLTLPQSSIQGLSETLKKKT